MQQNRISISGFLRSRTVGIIAIPIVLGVTFGIFSLTLNPYRESRIRELIHAAHADSRVGEGRLFNTPYSPRAASAPNAHLGRAQSVLLSLPASESRRELQSAIYLAAGDWDLAIRAVGEPASAGSKDPALLNDLGVAEMALGETEASRLLRAWDYLEKAAQLAPRAPEPLFNLVILYRKLRLSRLENETFQKYLELEQIAGWSDELMGNSAEPDEAAIHESLIQATLVRDSSAVSGICRKYPDICRRIVMQYALRNGDEEISLVELISKHMESDFRDATLVAMLKPLLGPNRDKIIKVRALVEQGAQLYLQSDPVASLAAYDQATAIAGETDSVFDRYWIDINRVDTLVRSEQIEVARKLLDKIIVAAREENWQWLLAKALTIYGSAPGLPPSITRMMEYLSDAENAYIAIGSAGDTVRPLYYLAALRHAAGDNDESLNVALRCLRLTGASDSVRLASLNWIIGSILYKKGLPDRAILFESESIEQARHSGNPVLLSASTSTLALLYEAISKNNLSEMYLAEAEDALLKIQPGVERTRAEINANLLKGRILLNRKRYEEAEPLLEANLTLQSQLPSRPSYLRAESLMLLAKVHAATGRAEEAARTFSQAIALVENDDKYLQGEKLRLAFDDERRELYDSAIAFEYDRNSTEAAWTYAQKYRAKLFLEFLAQFNPDIGEVGVDAPSRALVQERLPKDVQTVEYVLLKDRLIIWVISKDIFTSRSVAIGRTDLDAKVQKVLSNLRARAPVDDLTRELYEILIAPVADVLNPGQVLAIIPDRSLHGLPFGAIRYPDKTDYLIDHYSIVVSPSLSHLVSTVGVQPDRNAIASFGGQNDAVSEIKELSALEGLYGKATTAVGAEVTKQRFLSALATSTIFHYAGHSAYDAADPLRSSILLDGGRRGPNTITAVDIAQTHIKSNAIIVLSSCDSSVGNSTDGIGIRGLTSAFLIAGAGSVVGSLWPVENSSTTELMIRFHTAFATSHMPVAQALREAQSSFLKAFPERAHPYYWSGFVVTGNLSALR